MQVSDPMSTDTVTIKRNDRLILADHAMQERAIRHLPALDESGQVCGFLSQRDLFRGALLENFGVWGHLEHKMLDSLVVKEAMTSHVITITQTTPIGYCQVNQRRQN